MANCVYNFLRGLCSFVVGSLRMILFFGCLLAILAHTISLVILIKAVPDNDLQLPSGKAGFSDVLMSLGLLLLSFLGAYGSFYRHHPSIKAVSTDNQPTDQLAINRLPTQTLTNLLNYLSLKLVFTAYGIQYNCCNCGHPLHDVSRSDTKGERKVC